MIYTVTFNPAIDYIVHTDVLNEGCTNRSHSEEIYFGGKGINVSRVLAELGVKSVALGFVAGFTGEALEKYLNDNKILTDFVKLKEGFTRINIKVKNNKETEINAKGPNISEQEIIGLFKKLDKLAEGDTLILAGSVPSGLPQTVYEQIMSRLSGKSIRFVVDATGGLLTKTLKYKPFLIKPNQFELEEIFGYSMDSEEKVIFAARKLWEMGAQNVLVSLGSKGALLLDEYGVLHRKEAFKINAVNTVGAGDSMVAGFIAGCERSYDYALTLGSAAGAATAASNDLAKKENIFSFI